MIVDPVSHKVIDDVEYPEIEDYEGRRYFFGSIETAQKFRENPEKYIEGHEDEYGEMYPKYAEKA